MVSQARLGALLVVAGAGVASLSLTVGGSTALACPGLGGPVYDLLGVHPGGAELLAVDFAGATVEWYDGCNYRSNSLLPLGAGLVVSMAGVYTVVRHRLDG